jgi:hypothetical protein
MIIEGQYQLIKEQLARPAPPVPLDKGLATYSRDGLLTYPASCFSGTRLATKA